jgi:hypothetical protein
MTRHETSELADWADGLGDAAAAQRETATGGAAGWSFGWHDFREASTAPIAAVAVAIGSVWPVMHWIGAV